VTRPPPRLQPSSAIKLTGRGALVSLFGITFAGLLIAAWTGWNTLADALFMMSCGLVAWYTKSSGLRMLVVCPPLVFFAGSLLAQVFTAPGVLMALERLLVTLAVAAPWLFTGTALTFAIAFGRGYRPRLPESGAIASLRDSARDVRLSRAASGARWVRRQLVRRCRGLTQIRASGGAAGASGAGGTQLSGRGEGHVLLHRLDFLHVAEARRGQLGQDRAHEFLRDRRAAGHPDRGHAVEPAVVDLACVVDQVGSGSAIILGHLDQADGVR
jgi:hypothetical protein